MADAVLHGRIDFGRRDAESRVEEHRVVTESAFAARRMQDASVPAAFGNQRLRIGRVAQEHDARVEVRGALLFRYIAQCIEQLGDVGARIAVLAGVPRRIQAGRAAKRVDAQPGIVGQRG